MSETINFAPPVPGSINEILFSDGAGGMDASPDFSWDDTSKLFLVKGVQSFDLSAYSPGVNFISASAPAGGSYGFSVANTAALVFTQFPTHGGEVLVTLGAQTIAGVKTFTPNIMVNLAGDLFSRFGPVPTTATFSDGTDVLCSVAKQSGTIDGARAMFGAAEFAGSGGSSQAMQAINANASTISGSTGNLTATTNGGGLRSRYVCSTQGSGVVSQASCVSGSINAASGSMTDSSAFHAEAVIVGGGITVTNYASFWARTTTVSGTLTNWYGLRIDSPSGGSTRYQIALNGTGAGSGIYFNTPTAAGTEYIRNSASSTLDMNAATRLNFATGGVARMNLTSSALTITDGVDIAFTAVPISGNRIGTASTQAIGFWGKGAVTQPTNTTAINDVMANIGIRATGGFSNFTTTVQPRAGTSSANTAPVKFTSGTKLTTPENGAMEYDGTNLTFTRASATRENVWCGNDSASAPATNAIGVIVDYFGTSATRVLTTPNSWAAVNLTGTVYKIPLYT